MRIESSQLLPLAKLIPVLQQEYGVRLHLSTLHRWRQTGLQSHKLCCTRMGGRWLASLNDVREFFNKLGAPLS